MGTEGRNMYELAKELFPICRSITGEGVRETFQILKRQEKDLKVFEIPTGEPVFDWKIPKEWNIRDAYIENESGEKMVDFKKNNLHVLGYSTPVNKYLSLDELKEILYTLPEQPEAIPYRTSYYKERYGFCLSENQKNTLKEGRYHIVIDSELKAGSMTYGEMIIPGDTEKEILLSTYICHPSMANNECSGPSLAISLSKAIKRMKKRKYTYRIVFVPETIGAIAYLSRNLEYLKKHVEAGFVLTCVGDDRAYSMIESRYGDSLADKALETILQQRGRTYKRYSYLERGSDERQYCAPGVDLPVCTFCRSKFGEYKEYHTSLDNMEILSPEGFQGSFDVMMDVILALEYNEFYQVTCLCEPQLGARGLYPDMNISGKDGLKEIMAVRDMIGYADGRNDLFDLSSRIHVPVRQMIPYIDQFLENGLFRIVRKENK